MAAVLITYDLREGRHDDIKEAMKALGYTDTIEGRDDKSGKMLLSRLPNTTLWKDGISCSQAREALRACAIANGARIELLLAVEFDRFAGESDMPLVSYPDEPGQGAELPAGMDSSMTS